MKLDFACVNMLICNQGHSLKKKIKKNANNNEITEDCFEKKKRIQQISEKFVYFQKMKVVLISITSVI